MEKCRLGCPKIVPKLTTRGRISIQLRIIWFIDQKSENITWTLIEKVGMYLWLVKKAAFFWAITNYSSLLNIIQHFLYKLLTWGVYVLEIILVVSFNTKVHYRGPTGVSNSNPTHTHTKQHAFSHTMYIISRFYNVRFVSWLILLVLTKHFM